MDRCRGFTRCELGPVELLGPGLGVELLPVLWGQVGLAPGPGGAGEAGLDQHGPVFVEPGDVGEGSL